MAEVMDDNKYDRDWICPACGTLLNNQEGFSAGLDKWTCKVCNTLLEGDGDVTLGFDPEEGFKNARFPGIYWYCDNCGEFLNNQNGFDDHYDKWVCEECGHVNPITDNAIYADEYDFRRNLGIAYASEGENYIVPSRIFEGEEKFDFVNAGEKQKMIFGANGLGNLFVYGDIMGSTSIERNTTAGKVTAFGLYSPNFSIGYDADITPVSEATDGWSLVDCKDKEINGIKVDGKIGKGAILVQALDSDGEYQTVKCITNLFSEHPEGIDDLYETDEYDFLHGNFYRVIVAYQTHRKVGQKKIVFIPHDEFEDRYHIETYEFYAQCNIPVIGIHDIAVKERQIAVTGSSYESEKKYSYVEANPASRMAYGKKSLGMMMLEGQVCDSCEKGQLNSFDVASGRIHLSYVINPSTLKGLSDGWELSYEKTKQIDDIKIENEIGYGAIVVLKSVDGSEWKIDREYYDAFTEETYDNNMFYTVPDDIDEGVYYRILIAYQTRKLVGTEKSFIGSKDKYEYRHHVEVYNIRIEMDQETVSTDLWMEDNLSASYGFEIEKYCPNYVVMINGAPVDNWAKMLNKGNYDIEVVTSLGTSTHKLVTVDIGTELVDYNTTDEQTDKSEPILSAYTRKKALGTLYNTGTDNGYRERKTHIDWDTEDPHRGWDIGQFFVSGYTGETTDEDDTPVFLKVPGDKLQLWFRLEQDIENLKDINDREPVLNSDLDGSDAELDVERSDFGKGMYLVRKKDYENVSLEPTKHKDFLTAKQVGTNTIVDLFEEGDYEVALDYEIGFKKLRRIGAINNYSIRFKFKVRNGNCMVYPFDVITGDELINESMTENGFKLDLAESRYLDINIKRDMLISGKSGLIEDTRFNGSAADGREYKEEGLYTITVRNRYTGQSTEKMIFVGTQEDWAVYRSNGATLNGELLQEDQDRARASEHVFSSLDDPELLQYLADGVYAELEESLPSGEYSVDDIRAIYVSKEYLVEHSYNSQSNIFFGYNLSELDTLFQGTRYVFALDEHNRTTVQPFKALPGKSIDGIIQNVAIGAGVIVFCVVVSYATAGAGTAPAIHTAHLIFIASAKTAATAAASSALLGGASAAMVKGLQTGNMDEALWAATEKASDEFKWGAITGAAEGGLKEAVKISRASRMIDEAIDAVDDKAIKYEKGKVEIPEDISQWRQAELRALNEYGGYEQLTYLNGEQVPFGTLGGTRPDVIRFLGDHIDAVEVKYYDLNNPTCVNILYNELKREISSRIVNLPKGSTQSIVLDVTGRHFSKATIDSVVEGIRDVLGDIYPNIPIQIVGY